MREATKPEAQQRAGWTKAPFDARCNFHRDRPAQISFGGTPVCEACAKRIKPHD